MSFSTFRHDGMGAVAAPAQKTAGVTESVNAVVTVGVTTGVVGGIRWGDR